MTEKLAAKYQVYPLLGDDLTRLLRRSMGISKKKMDTQRAVQTLLQHDPQMTRTIDFQVLAEEHFWASRGKKVLFPLPEMIDSLLSAKFQIASESAFEFPFECTSIALPTDGPLGQVAGALVTWLPVRHRIHKLFPPFLKWAGLPEADHSLAADLQPDDILVTICHRVEERSGGARGCARSSFPLRTVPALLAAETTDQYMEEMGRYKVYDGSLDLTKEEAQLQLNLLRLVTGIALVNKAASEGVVHPGLPGVRFSGTDRLPSGASGYLVKPPSEAPEAKQGHHRRWHLRTLTDERYYRGEYADLARGSRVIFVKDAVVGLGEAYTVSNSSDTLQ